MKHSSSSMTLEQFQSLSSEQRRAMPIRERGPFYAQMFVDNLNRNVMAEAAKDEQAKKLAEKAQA